MDANGSGGIVDGDGQFQHLDQERGENAGNEPDQKRLNGRHDGRRGARCHQAGEPSVGAEAGVGLAEADAGDGEGDGDKGKHAIFSGESDEKKTETDDKKKPGPDTPAAEEVLRIEVLGNTMVRRLADQKAVEEDRRYRIASESLSNLLRLDEVVEFIAKRSREGRTPDRLKVVSYKPDTRPQDKAAALDCFQKLARDLGKDKVKGSWVETDDLGQLPPS